MSDIVVSGYAQSYEETARKIWDQASDDAQSAWELPRQMVQIINICMNLEKRICCLEKEIENEKTKMEKDLLLSEITPELRTQMCSEIDKGWRVPEPSEPMPRTVPSSGMQERSAAGQNRKGKN